MGILGAALGGVSSLAGDLFGASSAASQQKFEQRMADTTYQRTVADMKKAGLNPMMMMAKGGSPDPSPSGTGVAQGKMYGDAATKAANLALIAAQTEAQRANARQTDMQTLQAIPASIDQVKATTANLQRTGEWIQPQASAQLGLTNEQKIATHAQAERIGQLLPFDVATAQLQPALVSAQTKAASENAARVGQGEIAKWLGTDFVQSMVDKWHELVRGSWSASTMR